MKTLVVYYSKSGNNKYLARKCIEALGGDIEEITPRMSAFFFQVLSSLTGAGLGINPLKADLKEYDRVLLCGPVWMVILFTLCALSSKNTTEVLTI